MQGGRHRLYRRNTDDICRRLRASGRVGGGRVANKRTVAADSEGPKAHSTAVAVVRHG